MIRRLAPADVEDALALSTTAGWNQTRRDWERLLELEPEGCFGFEYDGRVVATTTAVRYGTELAWIGMVLTDASYRGRGYAAALMERALSWLDERGVRCQRLDATDMGLALYERFGFAGEYAVERWKREGDQAARPALELPRAQEADLDGAARMVLRDSETATAGPGSYAMTRPGRLARFFGPCRAQREGDARRLVEWMLARHGSGDVYWDLSEVGMGLASRYGFRPVRRLLRMRRGGVAQTADERVYAMAGFEYG
ncbi:MAG: GNAT family N-acetyltransferase [Bryobacteraceae bacterium]|nr:GNAT family N-acetyltransferase [Bryobacteraceae bacterium]